MLGLVAGLVLPPLILLALLYGTAEFTLSAQRYLAVSWTALGVLLAAAAGLAVLAGSRLSPVASLLGGLQYTVLGLLPILELTGLRVLPRDWLPRPLSAGYLNLGYLGFLLLLGVLLLVASAFPARWRGRPAPSAPSLPYHPETSSSPQPYPDQQAPGPYAREPWRSDDVTRPMRRD
ncbi:hypothetical protein ACQEUU_25575 [Nonomuraea sp. CA-218870]|uniref:hypothetical protein n=1 Tax=Nonomuraea sp. CA-218870 TaxID=3239998 RepID=UPI003D8F9512